MMMIYATAQGDAVVAHFDEGSEGTVLLVAELAVEKSM
jgi:hypothetical protein